MRSLVHRQLWHGVDAYVKSYAPDDLDWSLDTIRAHTMREAEAMQRAQSSVGRRFGAARLLEVTPDSCQIVSQTVPGTPLDRFLLSQRHWSAAPSLRPLILAGKLLQNLQRVPVNGDFAPIGEYERESFEEYCLLRLETIRRLGYPWLSRERTHFLTRAVRRGVNHVKMPLRTFCHRDYSPGNLIWDGQKLTVIDFAMAAVDEALVDVTYFVHRLWMLHVYFPWRRFPLRLWSKAFLDGYGCANEHSTEFQLMMLRHLLCRLQTFVRRRPDSVKDRTHGKWIRATVRRELMRVAGTLVLLPA